MTALFDAFSHTHYSTENEECLITEEKAGIMRSLKNVKLKIVRVVRIWQVDALTTPSKLSRLPWIGEIQHNFKVVCQRKQV